MKSGQKGLWLENLTWKEAQTLLEKDPVLILPIGAISKEHGHHLPLKTDFLLAQELSRRVADQLPVLVAPIVCFGYYPAFCDYPGSQNLSAETFMALMREILMGFIHQGFRKIVIINTGVSTDNPVRIICRELYEKTGIRVLLAPITSLGKSSDDVLIQKFGGHGDEHETSLILSINPEYVQMDKAVCDYGFDSPKTVFYVPSKFSGDELNRQDYTLTGIRGDATAATAEKGNIIFEAMTSDIVQGILAYYPEVSE